MTHADRIAAIRARAAAASSPWTKLNNPCDTFWASQFEGDEIFVIEARADIPFLLERNKALEAALGEAIEAIEDWGCYVPDHFKDKHDIQGDIDRLTAIKEGTTDAD